MVTQNQSLVTHSPLTFLVSWERRHADAAWDTVPGREAFRVPPRVLVTALFPLDGIDQGAHAAGVLQKVRVVFFQHGDQVFVALA